MRSSFIYIVFGLLAMNALGGLLLNFWVAVQGVLLDEAALPMVVRELEATLVVNGHYVDSDLVGELWQIPFNFGMLYGMLTLLTVGVLWCYAKRQAIWRRLSPRGVKVSVYVGESLIFIALLGYWFWAMMSSKVYGLFTELSLSDCITLQQMLRTNYNPPITYPLEWVKRLWDFQCVSSALASGFALIMALCWAVRAKRKRH